MILLDLACSLVKQRFKWILIVGTVKMEIQCILIPCGWRSLAGGALVENSQIIIRRTVPVNILLPTILPVMAHLLTFLQWFESYMIFLIAYILGTCKEHLTKILGQSHFARFYLYKDIFKEYFTCHAIKVFKVPITVGVTTLNHLTQPQLYIF